MTFWQQLWWIMKTTNYKAIFTEVTRLLSALREHPYWCITLAAIGAAIMMLLGGCSTTMPVVEPTPSCTQGVSATILSEPCQSMSELPAGSTYSDVLHDDKTTKEQLRSCSLKTATLQSLVKDCDAKVAEHNKRLTEINK